MAKHEENRQGFRLRLNLFDAIVILVAVAAAALLLWRQARPDTAAAGPAARNIQYTIRLQRVVESLPPAVAPGDRLEDSVKNYELGSVVSSTSMPATRSILNEGAARYVTAQIPGFYDVDIVVEAPAVISDEQVLLDGGYALRVGEAVYVRGPGYLGSGIVYAIERGEQG